MRRALTALIALSLLLMLAACAPAVHHGASATRRPSASSTTVSTPSPMPTPTPTVTASPTPTTPPVINSADYLVDGTPGHPDANGEWFGEYAFWTDSTKTVWCEVTIFSGDNPGATCSIVPSARSQATYPLPAGSSAGCAANTWDGYTLGLDASVEDLIPKDAGFNLCWSEGVAVVTGPANTKVLPDGATLTVKTFSCTVHSGVATCVDKSTSASNPASITMGLHTATFHSN